MSKTWKYMIRTNHKKFRFFFQTILWNVSGTTLEYNKHRKVDFFAYCQVHEENTLTNSMLPHNNIKILLVTNKWHTRQKNHIYRNMVSSYQKTIHQIMNNLGENITRRKYLLIRKPTTNILCFVERKKIDSDRIWWGIILQCTIN